MMTAHIIPAASNALMIKYLESEGFEKVYLDSQLISTQLLGTYDTDLLGTAEYLSYVQRLANVTNMAIMADAHVNTDEAPSWTLPNIIEQLEKIGCRQITVSDINQTDLEAFQGQLQFAQQAITNEDTEIIVKLNGFIDYGLNGLQERIDIAQENGFSHILLSNITNEDIAIIKAVATTASICVMIDNPNINYCTAEQLNPNFILDTYHVYEGLTKAAKSVSQNMVLKMFMG